MELKKSEYGAYDMAEYNNGKWKYNFAVNLADVALYVFSMSFISLNVVLPAFAMKLGASNMLISFIPSMLMIGRTLPQAFVSSHIGTLFRMKPFVLRAGFVQRIPWLFIAIMIFFLPSIPKSFALASFVVLFAISSFAMGFGGPAYDTLIAKAIPQKVRGRYQSVIQLIASVLSLSAGFLVKDILAGKYGAFPHNYSLLFFIAFVGMILSYIFCALNREVIPHTEIDAEIGEKKNLSLTDSIKDFLVPFREDENLRLYVIGNILTKIAVIMGGAFLLVYTVRKFSLSDADCGIFVIAMTVGAASSSVVLGYFADKAGHLNTLIVSNVVYICLALLSLLASSPTIMIVAFVLLAINKNAFGISETNMIYELCSIKKLPRYLALVNTMSAPFVIGASFVGGLLVAIPNIGFVLMFIVSASFALLSILVFMRLLPRLLKNTKNCEE